MAKAVWHRHISLQKKVRQEQAKERSSAQEPTSSLSGVTAAQKNVFEPVQILFAMSGDVWLKVWARFAISLQ